MSRISLNDIPGMAAAPAPFSRAVWAGDHLWVSGQTGIDPASGQLVKGGAGAETKQALANLSAVLKAAGLGSSDVVKANVYLSDMAHFGEMNRIYADAFEAPQPARTTVAVAGLPGEALVEIELVAFRGI